jgi:CubicO group peptidase (beta-lactamase class C family)
VLLSYIEGFSDPGPRTRANVTDAFYIQHMRENVFTPLGIATDCRPETGSHPKLSYHFPLVAGEHGTDWGDNTSICGGTGWSLSAYELYRVLLSLLGGTTLLTDAQKTQMNTFCLGWDCSVQSQTGFVGNNGILPFQNGTPGLWTFAGIFKGTVPVVVIINSVVVNNANVPDQNFNITGLVATAFNNAGVPHP